MKLTSVAIQVFNMDAMTSFYGEAFGIEFREVEVGGMACRFGTSDGLELKLVPMRASADFEGFPSHQLGLEVADAEKVLRLAESHGGRRMGDPNRTPEGDLHVGLRDPDGNTIELYQRAARS